MSREYNEPETTPQQNRDSLSIISENSVPTVDETLPRKIMRCAACSEQTEYTDDHAYCERCGAGLTSMVYSGHEPVLVVGYENYLVTSSLRPVNKRRHTRIPCRSVQAGIRTEKDAIVIVDVVSLSRGGVRFTSFATFSLETLVSIAIYYVEGGQNIFQHGRVIRVQRNVAEEQPDEYAIEFSTTSRHRECVDRLDSGKVSL
jgi:hypothetical protein